LAKLSIEAIERIADARRLAEAKLKEALSAVTDSEDVEECLPAFRAFASALFDAEAVELVAFCEDDTAFRATLEVVVAPRIVEAILPDRGLDMTWADMPDGLKRLSIAQDSDTGLLWEEGPDGTRKQARPEACGFYAHHGEWENFAPARVWFRLRFPTDRATVRAVLTQTLQQRVVYWAGRHRSQTRLAEAQGRFAPAETPAKGSKPSDAQFPKRASWLKKRLAERGWDKHTLKRYGGPEHRTTQKILDGLAVQENVLERVIAGLQSKPTHKGRTLPAVAESDIPND
jgi:hypothetical protein